MKYLKLLIFVLIGSFSQAQQEKNILHNIIEAVSENRLNEDIKTLANFGTRHTLSDTLSTTRGIGAARRWIKTEFETISKKCNNCLEVFYQKNLVKSGENNRIIKDVWVVNVVAIQRGTKYPNRFIIMSGDIDSRVSDPNNSISDSPGANDNASGMAGTIESARILSNYSFRV
jgi:Zn-dependent M28 family amino/carboxypeptidase